MSRKKRGSLEVDVEKYQKGGIEKVYEENDTMVLKLPKVKTNKDPNAGGQTVFNRGKERPSIYEKN